MSDVVNYEMPSKDHAACMPDAPDMSNALAEMFAQLPESIATVTETGEVISWNPPAASLTGYSFEEINDVGLWQLFEPPQMIERLVRQAREGTAAADERLVLCRADGQRVPVLARCSPLRHRGGSRADVVIVMRDVSELEALHDRLVQSERLNILGRLAGAVSHEIRNPLTAIFLQADILEGELHQPNGGNQAQIARSLTVIKDEAVRLHELAQQYLSLARLADLRREAVDLGVYVEAFCMEIHERVTARGITLQCEALDEMGQVALHRNSFRRALLNLLNNAVEAMPQGGTLTLRGRRTPTAVCLDISDTGCGIPQEQLPFLYSPFHTTKPEGTGLGLYLVHEIVTAHEGEMTVASTPEMGTTFTITLPPLPTERLRQT